MRHFRDEVAITQNTVIDGHAFRGDGLDSLGKQLVRQTLIHYFEYTLAIDRLLAKPLPKKHGIYDACSWLGCPPSIISGSPNIPA